MIIWAVTYTERDGEVITENVAAVDFETLCDMLGKSHVRRSLNGREILGTVKCGEITISADSFGKPKKEIA